MPVGSTVEVLMSADAAMPKRMEVVVLGEGDIEDTSFQWAVCGVCPYIYFGSDRYLRKKIPSRNKWKCKSGPHPPISSKLMASVGR